MVVHPGVALEDAEAIGHQRWVADAGFNVLVVGELSHELLVRMTEWVADDVLWLQALAQSRDQAALEERVGCAADGGIVAVEVGFAALE